MAENIMLTQLIPEDLPLLFSWINNREQVLFNAPYHPVHEGQHRAWFESIQQRKDLAIFAIRLCESDQLIGTCQLHSIDPIHRTAELQIRIGEIAQRGHGFGSQAVRLLLDFAFKDLNLHRVYLHVFATNTPAIRTYEKVGFLHEGLLREAAYIDGCYVDMAVMGILRDEHVK